MDSSSRGPSPSSEKSLRDLFAVGADGGGQLSVSHGCSGAAGTAVKPDGPVACFWVFVDATFSDGELSSNRFLEHHKTRTA